MEFLGGMLSCKTIPYYIYYNLLLVYVSLASMKSVWVVRESRKSNTGGMKHKHAGRTNHNCSHSLIGATSEV